MLTFGNRKKGSEGDGVPVCPTYAIVYVPDRDVQRIKVVLACGDGDRGLVASKDYWDERGALIFRPLCQNVLVVCISMV